MEAKKSRINKYGQYVLNSDNLREIILSGKSIDHLNVVFDDDIEKFVKFQEELIDKSITLLEPVQEIQTVESFHYRNSDVWLFPKEYQTLDVKQWLINKCSNNEQVERVNTEYKMFEERNLIMLLRLFIYVVDYMRSNNFVWGVGRGSSVSSYILYLIGIHRVDSMKYQLDIKDYLK